MKINLFARGQRARLQRAYSLSSPSWQFEDSYRVLERLLSLSDAAPVIGRARGAACWLQWHAVSTGYAQYKSARAQKRAAGIPAELLLQL